MAYDDEVYFFCSIYALKKRPAPDNITLSASVQAFALKKEVKNEYRTSFRRQANLATSQYNIDGIRQLGITQL